MPDSISRSMLFFILLGISMELCGCGDLYYSDASEDDMITTGEEEDTADLEDSDEIGGNTDEDTEDADEDAAGAGSIADKIESEAPVVNTQWGKLRSKSANGLCLDFDGDPAGLGDMGLLGQCADTGDDGMVRFAAREGGYQIESRADEGTLCVGFDSVKELSPAKLVECSEPDTVFVPIEAFPGQDNAGYLKLKLAASVNLCLDIHGRPGRLGDMAVLGPCDETGRDGEFRHVDPAAPDPCRAPQKYYDDIIETAVPALPEPAAAATTQSPFVAFDLHGHRGARGKRPESTLAGYMYALEAGATSLELDIIVSKDGRLVIAHDNDLTDTCDYYDGLAERPIPNGHPYITRMNYEDIHATYDCGYTPDGRFPDQVSVCGEKKPLLRHVVALVERWMSEHDHPLGISAVTYNLELKYASPDTDWTRVALDIRQVMVAYGAQKRTIIQSFRMSWLNAAMSVFPDARYSKLGYGYNDAGTDIAGPRHTSVTAQGVQKLHDAGQAVIPYTVNSPDRIQELYSMGVDGIITDYPDMASAYVCPPTDAVPFNVFGKFKSMYPGNLCLDADGDPSGALDDDVRLWDCAGTGIDGEFKIKDLGDGYVKLVSRADGKVLDFEGRPAVYGSPARLVSERNADADGDLQIIPCTGPNPAFAGLVFKLGSRRSASDEACPGGLMCLDVEDDAGARGGRVLLRCCSETGPAGYFAFCPGLP